MSGLAIQDPLGKDWGVGRIAVIREMELVAADLVLSAVMRPGAEVALYVTVRRAIEDIRRHQRVRIDDELVSIDPYASIQHLVRGQFTRGLIRINAASNHVILSCAVSADDEKAVHCAAGLERLCQGTPMTDQLTEAGAERVRATCRQRRCDECC